MMSYRGPPRFNYAIDTYHVRNNFRKSPVCFFFRKSFRHSMEKHGKAKSETPLLKDPGAKKPFQHIELKTSPNARKSQRTFLHLQKGYSCYELDQSKTTLQVLPSKFLPEELCACLPGWSGKGANCSKINPNCNETFRVRKGKQLNDTCRMMCQFADFRHDVRFRSLQYQCFS